MLTNIVLIFFVSIGTISAQILLKKGILLLGGIHLSSGIIVEIIRVFHSPYVLGALFVQGIIVLVWIFVLSRTQLIYLFTMSGAFFYILLAIASWLVLGERLTLIHWLGVLMISFGVLCLNYHSL